MKLIFFCILRRFFVKLRIKSELIVLEKTLILSVKTVVNRKEIVRIQTRRTPIMRALHAKEVTLFTNLGKMRFFLGENEPCEILPKSVKNVIKPRFREVIFGAFIDAKALAGITFFAITLSKIGKILGENYLDSAIRALFTTAESITDILAVSHIVLPKAAVFIGIAAISAWFLGFLRKITMLFRFEFGLANGSILVKCGVVTLYENLLVQNSAVISRVTLFSLITRRTTLYCRKVLVIPCADKARCKAILRRYFGLKIPKIPPIKSPCRAFFGHCALPLWIFGISSVTLVITLIIGSGFTLLLRTAAFSGVLLSTYLIFLNYFYFFRENHIFTQNLTVISCKKYAALYTAYFPRRHIALSTLSLSPFDKSLCTITLALLDRSKFRAKLIPFSDLVKDLAG